MKLKTLTLFWLCAGLLGLTSNAVASHADIARLATQLNLASGQLAYELRGVGGYSGIRQRAERLSRESADLVDAVRRDRSSLRVQAQFEDVRARYASLEDALLRATRQRHDPWLFAELDRLSGLYSQLNQEFYFAGGYASPRAYGYNPPLIIQRHVAPPLPRGPVFGGQSWRDNGYGNARHADARPDRRDYGRIEVQRLPSQDHRSPVLERQQRLDNRRNPVESGRAHPAPAPEHTDRTTARERGGEPERRARSTETGRRNHYE